MLCEGSISLYAAFCTVVLLFSGSRVLPAPPVPSGAAMLCLLLPMWRLMDDVSSVYTNEGVVVLWTLSALACWLHLRDIYDMMVIWASVVAAVFIAEMAHSPAVYRLPVCTVLLIGTLALMCGLCLTTAREPIRPACTPPPATDPRSPRRQSPRAGSCRSIEDGYGDRRRSTGSSGGRARREEASDNPMHAC